MEEWRDTGTESETSVAGSLVADGLMQGTTRIVGSCMGEGLPDWKVWMEKWRLFRFLRVL